MQVGATLGRRFTLVREEEYDLPGVERFVALDTRLTSEVSVHVVTSSAPSAVRTKAARAVRARDARLAKVIATGRETHDGDAVTYVVTQRISGLRLDAVLASRVLPVPVASALVAQAAAALAAVAPQGHHHGHLRPAAITVTPRGRVVVSGLGLDGELATQGGIAQSPGKGERADAVAAASIFLTAITGKDVDDVRLDDIPETLSRDATVLCRAVLNGSGPRTLANVVEALGTFSPRELQDFESTAASAPLRPAVLAELEAEAQRVADYIREHVTIDPQVIAAAALVVEVLLGRERASGDVARLMDPSLDAPLSRLVRPEGAGPEDYVEGAVDDLYTFEVMAAEQNAAPQPAVYEDLLRRLHARFPRSAQLTRTWEHARARAQRSGPINAAPLLLSLSVLTLVVAAMTAATYLTTPAAQGPADYEHPYPSFTFSPSPEPTVSPSPSPEE